MFRKSAIKTLLLSLSALAVVLIPINNALADSFNSSNLISNEEFIGINSMSASDIQNFLNDKNSCLKSYSQNGRSAAQIIYDASHGYGEASGSINGITINTSTGTVSPGVLLATLQKEQSLISSSSCSDGALNAAMGYGCPDSGGCSSTYAGFTNQVEWGAWQLRYNYERAYGHGFSDYQVGQSFCFDDWNGTHCGTYDNQATASLYRYTPHVYNGNYNFWNLYHNTYQFQVPAYSYSYVSQNGYPSLFIGDSYQFSLTVRNTGTQTWYKNQVNLGTSRGKDRISGFLREGDGASGWISGNRIQMQESSVAPGSTATFVFWMKVPSNMPVGTYNEYFQLVADGHGWMEDYGIYWGVTVRPEKDRYSYTWTSQNGYPTISQDSSGMLSVTVTNNGSVTWYRNQVNLGTSRSKDRISSFIRESTNGSDSGWISPNRIHFKESSVAPGATATYEFYMKTPSGMPAGTYREYFQLVADGTGWLQDYGIYWDITVPQPTPAYSYSWTTQNGYPTLNKGEAYKFSVTVTNNGTQTWQKNQVNLGTSRGKDRISGFIRESTDGSASGWISGNRIQFKESSVAPGQTATYEFYMKVPTDFNSGTYREYFQVVADGIGWLQDYGIYWEVRVN